MIADAAPADETRFMRINDVLRLVPVSRPTIYRLMGKGEFPRAVRIGSSSLWIESEVHEFMKSKVAAR